MKSSLKVGKKVEAHSPAKNGVQTQGRIVGVRVCANGTWYDVNHAAPRRAPSIKSYRASHLELVR
jgi:hypothetical protein